MQHKKPSEKLTTSVFDGKEIVDSLGRKLTLKKPDILDLYDLMSAIADDSKSQFCQGMAMNTLYIALIDGQPIEPPKSYREFRAVLKRIGEEGLSAIMKFMEELANENPEKEQIEKVKK